MESRKALMMNHD